MDIWQINKNQKVKLQNLEVLPHEGYTWIDGTHDDTKNILNFVQTLKHVPIYDRHVEDCLNPQHPCSYESVQAYDILIFRSLECGKKLTETKPISFIIFKDLLVSLHYNDSAIDRIKIKLEQANKRLPSNTMSFLLLLLDEVVDNFLDLRGPLLERFSHWQNALFLKSDPHVDWLAFLNFKTEIRKLRTLSEDQQEVIYQWHQDNQIGLPEQLLIKFNDLSNHIRRIIRYSTQLENDFDTLTQLFYSLIGNRTNDEIRILTVLSAIFLPLNLIAGIFGMNFTHMRFLQVPNADTITLILMGILAFILFVIFKWKDWI